jgi:adenylate cyclase
VSKLIEVLGDEDGHQPRVDGSEILLDIALLGPVVVTSGGETLDISGKMAALFALVATAPGASLVRETIASQLWGGKDSERASHNLRQLVARIRKLPCASAFTITETRMSLVHEKTRCDFWLFKHVTATSSQQELVLATDVFRGAFCQGLDINEAAFDDWLSEHRSTIQMRMADACIRLAGMELSANQLDRAIRHAKQAVAIDEFREDGHRLLMQALVAADRRSEAIRHYDILCAFLEREIDCEPDELTQTLAVSLKQETHVTPQTAPAVRLTATSTEWMQRLAEAALDSSTLAILMIQCGNAEQPGKAAHFTAACTELAQSQAITVVQMQPTFSVLQAASVKLAVTAGLALLAQSIGAVVQIGVHPLGSDARGTFDDSVLVARQLCRLAKPGELLLSLDAHEQLLTAHDITITDHGETAEAEGQTGATHLRTFSVQPEPENTAPLSPLMPSAMLPLIAIIPFTTFATEASHHFLGEMLADEMITILSRSADTRLISRLSTAALAGKSLSDEMVRNRLGAAYAATGNCYVMGDKVRLTVEFTELETSQIIFLESIAFSISDAFNGSGHIDELARKMVASIMNTELRRASTQPFSSLANSTLMLGAVAMMHQLSKPRFELSREMLEALTERDRKHPAPHSWLAMYRLLRVSQGWSDDADKDAALASASSQRALDLDPSNSLALAVDGHIQTQFRKDLSGANKRLTASLESNPSNGMAWLFKSTMHAFLGEGEAAMFSADSATRLSPLDPRRWFYDSLAATAAVGAKRYNDAIVLAKRSIQANATHTSTYRALAIAQSLSGQAEDARETVRRIVTMQPGLTATDYRKRHPVGDSPVGKGWANALHEAGLPL